VSHETDSVPAARRLVRVLSLAALLLLAGSLGGQAARLRLGHDHLHGLVPLLDADAERNLPSVFSTLLLAGAAWLLAGAGLAERRRGASWLPWAGLAAGFLVMAADEALSFHERLIRPMRAVLGGGDLGPFHFAWVAPALVLVTVLGLAYLRFLLRLPAGLRRALVSAAAVYLAGAVGMEMVAGPWVEAHGRANLTYALLVAVEEGLEMAGVILLIRTMLLRSDPAKIT
jgi:hypothetical protein